MALDSLVYNKFRSAFEQNCFQLINEAYQISLNEKIIQQDWNENDISQELIEKVDDNPLRLKWNITASREFYWAKNDAKGKGFADKLPRIDFKFSSIFAKQEFRYYIEAKRLKENDSKLKRGYIKEGMDRFISQKYPYGCMLAYLFEGESNKTIEGINRLLAKDKRSSEILNFKNHNFFNSYFESYHTEIGILKHLVLDLTSISN